MEDYYEYLDSNGVTTLYKLIKDDTVALINGYSVTINGITTNLDNHVNNTDIHTPISDIENMIDTKVSGLVNSAPETLDTLKELSDALGNDPNFATTVANQIGTKADKDSVYTKQETDTLLEGKANSVHNHVVSDITDFPTIPTKLSQLENDMGFGSGSGGVITSISWTNITDKPNFATVATSGSYTDLSNTPAIPSKLSQLENDTGFVSGLTDVVDTKSNQTIGGDKIFQNVIYRQADITTSTVGEVYRFSDTNATPCGAIYNRMHWYKNNVYNRHQAYNATSDKDMNLEIQSHTDGSGVVNTGGSVTNNKNLTTVTSGTDVSYVATMGWVNNPATSTNVVHRSGDETIAGNKTFSNRISFPSGYYMTTDANDNSLRIIRDGSNHGNNYKIIIQGDTGKVFAPNGFQGNLQGNADTATSANDPNAVHKTGNETIKGFKSFTEVLDRRNDVTISTVATATQLVDTNANRCGWIANRMHWAGNYHVHNRHIAYNENSGKEVYIDIISSNNGSGGLFVGGTATNINLNDVTSATDRTALATMGWVNNPATSTNVVHRSGNEAISGAKIFLNDIFRKNTSVDLTTTPTGYTNTNIKFADKNDKTIAYFEFVQRPHGVNDVGIFAYDKNDVAHGIHINTNNEVIPLMNSSESYSLGSPNNRWANVYAARINCDNIESHEVRSTTCNAFMAQYGSYTFLIRNDGSNTYLLMSDKDGTPGTWSTARPLIINNATGVCSINGHADSATYATTQATSDNSTKIATTAWVRNYVNSVVGSGGNTLGSSISAYWSDSSNITATGQASSGGQYPSCYSEYITKTPTVGTIYSGAQLYTVLNTYASATGSTGGPPGTPIFYTNTTARAIFSTSINPSGKYLCTTANTVKFRAYTAQGSTSSVGSSSVVDNSSTKSIFIRVQ